MSKARISTQSLSVYHQDQTRGRQVARWRQTPGRDAGNHADEKRAGIGKVNRLEVFDPFALLTRYTHFQQAIATINDPDYGLQAGLFTHDLRHAMHAWHTPDQGGVVINDVPSFRVDNMPYGGVKLSGVGKEGVRMPSKT